MSIGLRLLLGLVAALVAGVAWFTMFVVALAGLGLEQPPLALRAALWISLPVVVVGAGWVTFLASGRPDIEIDPPVT